MSTSTGGSIQRCCFFFASSLMQNRDYLEKKRSYTAHPTAARCINPFPKCLGMNVLKKHSFCSNARSSNLNGGISCKLTYYSHLSMSFMHWFKPIRACWRKNASSQWNHSVIQMIWKQLYRLICLLYIITYIWTLNNAYGIRTLYERPSFFHSGLLASVKCCRN